jgi:hypothetical protein
MPTTTHPGGSALVPDPIKFLQALPKRRRNLILAFVNALHIDELECFGIFLKGIRPDTSDDDIATMCGVSRAKMVTTWKLYQAAKPRREDHWPTRRQPSKWRASTSGGRWPLDPPDEF